MLVELVVWPNFTVKDEIKYVNNKIVESINKLYTIDGDNKIYSDNYSIKFKYDKDGRFWFSQLYVSSESSKWEGPSFNSWWNYGIF